MMRLSLALVVLLLAAPVAAAQEPPLPADTIARVEQQPILRADFVHWMDIANRADGLAAHPLPALGSPQYKQLTEQVMQLLISYRWIDDEARDRGVHVSDAAIRRSFLRQKRLAFPKESEYQKFLAQTGQTEADVLQRVRLDLLSNKLRDVALAGAKTERGQQRRFDRWVKRFTARWRGRTVCGEPYKTEDCGRTLPIAG